MVAGFVNIGFIKKKKKQLIGIRMGRSHIWESSVVGSVARQQRRREEREEKCFQEVFFKVLYLHVSTEPSVLPPRSQAAVCPYNLHTCSS